MRVHDNEKDDGQGGLAKGRGGSAQTRRVALSLRGMLLIPSFRLSRSSLLVNAEDFRVPHGRYKVP